MDKGDILIQNGRIFDPAQEMDFIGDVLIADGRICAAAPRVDASATTVLDATGFIVSPGWIDIHGHLYEGSTPNGLPIDMAAIPMGVTAVADAGSSGVANYPNLLKYLRDSKIRGRLMLNVSACGIIMPAQFPEPLNFEKWDMGLFRRAARICGEDLIAIKVRVQKSVVKELGLEPLRKAVEVAEMLNLPVVVHATDPCASMVEITDCLRPGDVLCHVYHGSGETILQKDGTLDDGIRKARERGVIFDAASGRGNISLDVARAAIAQGFLPDSISTDVTLQNWNHPLAGALPTVMSKYLPLGMSLSQIIACVTSGPAVQFRMDGLGTLKAGTPADITVFALEEKNLTFRDKFDASVTCRELFVPKATIVGGELHYRSVDCGLL